MARQYLEVLPKLSKHILLAIQLPVSLVRYSPGITRPQGYVPELTNHWLRFKIVQFSHLMIIGESTCDVTRVARHSTIVVKVVTCATLLLVRKIQTLTEESYLIL